MFEKHRNGKQDPGNMQAPQDSFTASPKPAVSSGKAAVIGPGIQIKGDITGDENLIVEGKVSGKIKLDSHQVDIGQNGQVNADITARVIKISGKVRGDLNGTEKVVISSSGNVHGNIVAPRMTLEDGAIFKGSIDMDPGEPAQSVSTKVPARKAEKKIEDKKIGEAPKVATGKVTTGEKPKESTGYSLNGG